MQIISSSCITKLSCPSKKLAKELVPPTGNALITMLTLFYMYKQMYMYIKSNSKQNQSLHPKGKYINTEIQ